MMKENLTEGSHDSELENILEDAAKKNNLTTFNVKNILKCLIADENVKTYIKKHLSDTSPTNKESKEEKIGKLKYIIPDFYPKYTRSKVKDLKKSGNISSSIWPVLSPSLANKPLADINYDAETIKIFETPLKPGSGYSNNDHNGLKFGDIEFPSDDDDEDFTIEKEIEKNIISPTFDSSLSKTDMLLDMIENGRSVADPQSTTSKIVVAANPENKSFLTMHLDSQSDIYDDYEGDENELLNANIEDMASEIEYLKWVDACLSKPPPENNNTQSLESSKGKRQEFELVNNIVDDGIVSQYRQQNSEKNIDFTLNDSVPQKDKEIEDTELDDDPEYDLMGELENFVEDPEDLRDDRAVHVSRKELNDLLNELFDDDGNHITQHTTRTLPTLRSNRNNKNFNSNSNRNKLKPKISDTPTYKFTVVKTLNNPDKNKDYLVENDREQYNIETSLPHFTAQQIGTLNTQMQQHIQLLMQTYLLGCEHQSLYPIKEMSRILIKELGTLFTSLSAGKNVSQSSQNNCNLQFCNLSLALNLIATDCERVCRDRHYFAYYDRAADTLVFHNNGNFNETLISQETMYEMANCTGLLYPILLPHRGFKRNKFDVTFEQSNNEENIVVSGLMHGGKYFKRVKHNIFDIVKWKKEKPDFKDFESAHKSTTNKRDNNNRINLSPSFLPSESRLLALGFSYFLTNNSSPFDYFPNKFCKILQSRPVLNQIWQNLQSVFNNANNNKTGECVEKTQIFDETNLLTTNLNWKNIFQAISMHLMPCKTLRSLVNKAVRDIEIILIKDKCCTKMDNLIEGDSINTENTQEQTIKSIMQTLDNNVFCELSKIFTNEPIKISESLEELRLYSGQLCLVDKNTKQDSKNVESYVTPLKFLLESDDSFDIVYNYHQNFNENSTRNNNCNVKEILIGMKIRLPQWLTQFAALYRANQESFDSMFEALRFNEQCRKKTMRSSFLNHRAKAKTPLDIMRNLLIHSHSTRPYKRTVYLSALKIRKKYRKLLTCNDEKKKNQHTNNVKFRPNLNLGENTKQQLTLETQNKEKASNKKPDSCIISQSIDEQIFANKRFLRARKSTLHHKKSSQNTPKITNEPNSLKYSIVNDSVRNNDISILPNEVAKTHSMDCENVIKDVKTTAASKVNSPTKCAVTSLKLKKYVRTKKSLEHTIDLLHKSSRVDIMKEESGYALADYFLKMAKKVLDSSTYQQMLQIIISNPNLIRCNIDNVHNDENDLAYYMLYENMEKLIGKDKPELFALFTLFLPSHVMPTLMSAKKLFAKQKNALTFQRIHAFLSLVKVYISKSPSLYHRKFVRRIEQWRLSSGTLKELYQILAFTCRQNTFLLHRLDSVFYGMDIHTESYVALEKGYGFECIDLTATINEQPKNNDNTIPGGVLQEFSDSNNCICVNGKMMSLDTFETIPYVIGPAPTPAMNNKSSNLQTTIIKRQNVLNKTQHQPSKKRKEQKNRKTVSNDLNTIGICTNQLAVNDNFKINSTLINSKDNNVPNKNNTSIIMHKVENMGDLETFINIQPKRSDKETIQSMPKNVNDNQLIELTTPNASDRYLKTPSKQNVWSKNMDVILIKGLQSEQALNQTLTQINDFLQANNNNINKNNGDLHTSKITIQDLKDRIETLNQLYNKFNQKH